MLYLLIGIVAGVIIGIRLTNRKFTKNNQIVGDLVLDHSDEDGPYLFLELNRPVNQLEKDTTVRLNMIHKNYISQK